MTPAELTNAVNDAAMYLGSVQRVVNAITVKGPTPSETDAAFAKVKHDWPTLGDALQALVDRHVRMFGK